MTLPDPDFWRGRRVLVTGATGFKGAWLSLWLARMGAVVTGYALPPTHSDGIYGASGVAGRMTPVTADVRHSSVLRQCLHLMRPDVVFHLAGISAAENPVETYDVNALGTVRVLEELRLARGVRTAVIATSDAVYAANDGRACAETDRLGGQSIYGASKAAAELAAAALRESLGEHRLKIATVRTSCVIGGGDWTRNRLVPDAMRAFISGEPLQLHTPDAVGHWLYVLDALAGYLVLAERLQEDPRAASAWNIGADAPTGVRDFADVLVDAWNADDWREPRAAWESAAGDSEPAPPIALDCGKAHRRLDWSPRFTLDQATSATVTWHAAQSQGEDMAAMSAQMLDDYLES